MSKFAKGLYQIKNKEKYIGRRPPMFRSSWENIFMLFLDNHPSILQWAGEGFASIPYHDPLTQKTKMYLPDFFMIYVDSAGVKHAEVVEVKPDKQTGRKNSKSLVDKAATLRNHAKWASALQWCAKNGCTFRLITDTELFKNGGK